MKLLQNFSDQYPMRVSLKLNPSDEVRERLEELARFRGRSLAEVMHSVLSTGLFLEEGMLVVPKLD